MTTINDDWVKRHWTLLVDGVDYDVMCYIYLRLKDTPDPHHWPPRHTQVEDYTLEGWDCLPALVKFEHEQEIENQLLQRLDDEYRT